MAEVRDFVTYIPFCIGSFLLIVTGGMLLFAPAKFVAIARQWGRKIGFPNANHEWKMGGSLGWLNGDYLAFTFSASVYSYWGA